MNEDSDDNFSPIVMEIQTSSKSLANLDDSAIGLYAMMPSSSESDVYDYHKDDEVLLSHPDIPIQM